MKLTQILVLVLFNIIMTNPSMAESEFLKIAFKPAMPVMHLDSTVKVGKATVYDHSNFSITLTNRHYKPIKIKSVIFTSVGDKEKSGLGDIVNYWPWRGKKVVNPRKSISFKKVWGFVINTPNTEMTYQYKFIYTIGNNTKEHVLIKHLLLKPEG